MTQRTQNVEKLDYKRFRWVPEAARGFCLFQAIAVVDLDCIFNVFVSGYIAPELVSISTQKPRLGLYQSSLEFKQLLA